MAHEHTDGESLPLRKMIDTDTPDPRRFDGWNVSLLIDFIVQHHHYYVRRVIPQLRELLDKVCDDYGDDCLTLFSLREDFCDLADALLRHLPKEEALLFPAVLSSAHTPDGCRENARYLAVSIHALEHEHDEIQELVKSIRTLTHQYIPPPQACPVLKMTYVMLQQFDQDLVQHLYLENRILFPKASPNVIF